MKNQFLKKLSSLVLSTSLILGLAACGSGNGKEQSGAGGENANNTGNTPPEWVYVPEFLDVDASISLYNTTIIGDSMYYTSRDYDMETGTQTMALCSRPLTGGEETRVTLETPEGASINSWNVGEDGAIYALSQHSEWDEVEQTSHSTYWLIKYDDQGSQIFCNDVTDLISSSGQYVSVDGVCVDAQGRISIAGSAFSDMDSSYTIWLFDQEGNSQDTIPLSGWIGGIFQGGNGNIYVSYYDQLQGGYVMAEVSFEKKSLGTAYSNTPGSSAMYPLSETTFLAYDGTSVYEYDMESQSTEALFDWLDSDINGDGVRNVSVMEDGRIAVIYQDWMLDENGIALLTKTSSAEVPQKQQVVIAVMRMDTELQSSIVRFNKASDQYHVSVKSYVDSSNWYENMYADALTNLNNDITSGNCPDIIALSMINVDQLAVKGVFEDLTPYLAQSSVLDRSDMIENVLNAFTYDEVLVGIPNSFSLETLVCSAELVGDEPGWTLEEMIALSQAHPDAELFDRYSKFRILQACLMYNMDKYVNWEEGKCSFNSDEFKALLEFANSFPDDDQINWEIDASEPGRISKGEVLMATADFYDFDRIQMYSAMYGDKAVTCIGYPNSDGSSGCILNTNGALAITAKSNVKDGAWAFIESYLSQERSWFSSGFPNSRSELEEMVVEATEPQYVLDENGDPWLDENGEPMLATGTSTISYGNDWTYTFRMSTREEAEQILELIEVAKPVAATNDQISLIISEEVEAFFQGQKPVDMVMDAIQSRAGVYVDENS